MDAAVRTSVEAADDLTGDGEPGPRGSSRRSCPHPGVLHDRPPRASAACTISRASARRGLVRVTPALDPAAARRRCGPRRSPRSAARSRRFATAGGRGRRRTSGSRGPTTVSPRLSVRMMRVWLEPGTTTISLATPAARSAAGRGPGPDGGGRPGRPRPRSRAPGGESGPTKRAGDAVAHPAVGGVAVPEAPSRSSRAVGRAASSRRR